MPATLSREVLKWIQSLDLSYSVKNLRRDFSNGFLIAEIFSRYFPQDIQMHSFDNGASLSKKTDNWEQLMKFFRKKNVPVTQEMVDALIHSRPDAAPPVVEAVYCFLTNRTVPPPVKAAQDVEVIPPFARPTASTLVKEQLKDVDPVSTDVSRVLTKSAAAIESHNVTLRSERSQEPGRFAAANRLQQQRQGPRGPPAQVAPQGAEQADVPVQFKEVQVKAVEVSVSQLRASKEAATSSRGSVHSQLSTRSAGLGPQDLGSSFGPAGGPVPGSGPRPLAEALSAAVQAGAEGALLGALGRRGRGGGGQRGPDLFGAFLEALPRLAPEQAAGVLAELSRRARGLAESLAASPKDSWRFFGALAAAMGQLPPASPGFAALAALLGEVGVALRARDAAAAGAIFAELALPKLAPLLAGHPAKRAALLRGMYSYYGEEAGAHVRAVKQLQEALGDTQAFVACVAALAGLEAALDETLLDLYLYYALIGLASPSPPIRAAALSILPRVARERPPLVLQLLDRLRALAASERWWEAQLQLLLTAAALLGATGPGDPAAGPVLELVEAVAAGVSSPHVARAAAPALAPLTRPHPGLARPLVLLLLSAPEPVRLALLGLRPDAAGAAGASGALRGPGGEASGSITGEWGAAAVAGALAARVVEEEKLGNLEREHMHVLYAAVVGSQGDVEGSEEGLGRPFEAGDAGAWTAVFERLVLFVYVALCDEEIAAMAAPVLRKFVSQLPEAAMRTFNHLLSALLMIFPAGPDLCRELAAELLADLYARGEPLARAVYVLVRNFPEQLLQSQLAPFAERVLASYPAASHAPLPNEGA
eukprot:tig00020780_g13790.t1